MKKFKFLSLVFVGFVLSSTSFAGEHLYRLEKFPVLAASCHIEARDQAAIFTEITGIPSTGRCQRQNSDATANLVIKYLAENPVNVVSTTPLVLHWDPSRFDSLEDCQAQLPNEKAIFEEKTELQAAYAYCLKTFDNPNRPDENSWHPRIDGFGDAEIQPHTIGTAITNRPVVTSRESLKMSIISGLRQNGIEDVVFVKFDHRSPTLSFLIIQYYGDKRIQLTTNEVVAKSTLESCEEAKQLIDQWHLLSNMHPVAHFCASALSKYEVTSIEISPALHRENSLETFSSEEECETHKEEIVALYRNDIGLNVYGGICSRPLFDWHVTIFAER